MIPTSLAPGATVSAQDRSDVIDLVNRLNMAFDVWDLDTMLGLHTDDFIVHHPKGVATGHDPLVAFYEAYYPLTVGVRRQHLNHVVTGNDDGTITVLSYNLLIRVATRERAAALKGQSVIEAESGLPGIAMHSVMIDRFRRDPGHGWRFAERHVERRCSVRPTGRGGRPLRMADRVLSAGRSRNNWGSSTLRDDPLASGGLRGEGAPLS